MRKGAARVPDSLIPSAVSGLLTLDPFTTPRSLREET